MSTNIIYDSLDQAVKTLITGSYLDNGYQYTPLHQLGELSENSAWPKITTDVSTGSVQGQRVDVTLNVSILFLPVDLDVCQTEFERNRRVNAQAEFHKRTLIEIYYYLIGTTKMSNGEPFRDYNFDRSSVFNIYRGIQGLDSAQKDLIMHEDIVIVSMDMRIYDSYVNLCCSNLDMS